MAYFQQGAGNILWEFYWHGCTTQLHIDDAKLLLQQISKVVYWIGIWTPWWPFEFSELTVMFEKPVKDYLSFVTWCVILWEALIRRWNTGLKRDGHGQQQYCCFQWCSTGTIPASLHHHWQAGWSNAAMLFTPNSDSNNCTSQRKLTLETRQHFSKFLLSIF